MKIITLLLSLLLLSGCIPAAILAGATAGGAIIYDKRSFKTMNQDQRSREWAQRLLDTDSKLKGRSHITIAVFNNVGLLSGQSQSPEIRARAFQIVTHVKYINKIYNEITIAGASSHLQRLNDDWITSKVRTSLLSKRGLHSNNIKVVTEDGIVFLMGAIGRSQANLATETARRVGGVKKVVKVFEYD